MHRLTSIYIISLPDGGRLKLGFHSGTIKALKTRYRTSLPDHHLERFISHPRAKEVESIVHETLRSSTVRCIKVTETDNNSEWYEIRLSTLVELIETCIKSMDALRATAGDVLERTGAIALREYGDIDRFRTYLPKIVGVSRVAVIDGKRCILRASAQATTPTAASAQATTRWTRIDSRDEMVDVVRRQINLRLLQQLTDESIEIWNTIPYTLRREWGLEIDERFTFDVELVIAGIADMVWTMPVTEFISAYASDPMSRIEVLNADTTTDIGGVGGTSLLHSKPPYVRRLCPEDLLVDGLKMLTIPVPLETANSASLRESTSPRSTIHSFAMDALRGVPCTVTVDASPDVYRVCNALLRIFVATGRTAVAIGPKVTDGASAVQRIIGTDLTGVRDIPRDGHSLVISERTDKKITTSLAGKADASILILLIGKSGDSPGDRDDEAVIDLLKMYVRS